VVHYRVHKNWPFNSVLSQPNPGLPLDVYLSKVHLNVILPLMRMSSKWLVPFETPNHNLVNTFPSPMRATYLAHLIVLDLRTLRILDKK